MKIDNVTVHTDGTVLGTKVLVADEPLEQVHALRREGRNLFITIRVRDAKVEPDENNDFIEKTILAGDWALALKEQPALKAQELLTPKRAWA